MSLLLLGLFILLISAAAALVFKEFPAATTKLGAGGAVLGGLVALIPALQVLLGGHPESRHVKWAVPGGSFFIELDTLSAFFLVIILCISMLAAVYGSEYLTAYRKKRSTATSWFFFNTMIASMMMVTLARNAVLFLVAWEIMALSSFFLVIFEGEKDSVREAGITYLVATHIGTMFLIALFLLLGAKSGSLDFDQFTAAGLPAGALFVMAVIGFGTKAGFAPLHVWMPSTYPAAPSYVTAVMSGVMSKLGIYGLIRMLLILGPPGDWWGILLMMIGLVSALGGILFALAQEDIKRFLAYSSVENIGIITLGLGLGMFGLSRNSSWLILLGFGGAFIHILNHAVFKSLLFFGAGSIIHATGTRKIDELGGLLKKMPRLGLVFLVGCVAIAGLPPLNGFVGEFLIFVGALQGGLLSGMRTAVIPCVMVIVALALVGGLAAAGFTKVFGTVFLGEPRDQDLESHGRIGSLMMFPQWVLAIICPVLVFCTPLMILVLSPILDSILAACSLGGVSLGAQPQSVLLDVVMLIWTVVGVSLAFILLGGAIVWLRNRNLRDRPLARTVTWDCGYAQPTARMQYTASSFVQPITAMFQPILRTRKRSMLPSGYFPHLATLHTDTPDVVRDDIYVRSFAAVERWVSKFRRIQHGKIQFYILYIVLTLLGLMVWHLMIPR